MNETCSSELSALLASGFTGRITLHCEKGSVKRVDTRKTWRPREGRGVEITEAGGGT